MEQAHVVDVGLARRVAGGVAQHLDVRAEASHRACLDPPTSAEAVGREHPIAPVLHAVHPVPPRVEGHRVDVDLAPRAVAQDEVRVRLAAVEHEPVDGQGLAHRRDIGHAHDEVEILVGPRLFAEHRIDRPAAIEPGLDPRAIEALEDHRDVVSGHHRDRLTSYGARLTRPGLATPAHGAYPRGA